MYVCVESLQVATKALIELNIGLHNSEVEIIAEFDCCLSVKHGVMCRLL